MKKSLIALVAAIVILPSLYAAISPQFYKAEVEWKGYKEARALNSDKPIFVFAKMRFCSTCAAMEKDVFTDPSLAKALNEHFTPVQETINLAFSSFVFDDLKDENGETLEFRGFPAVMIVKGDKYIVEHGYKNIQQLHTIINHVLEN